MSEMPGCQILNPWVRLEKSRRETGNKKKQRAKYVEESANSFYTSNVSCISLGIAGLAWFGEVWLHSLNGLAPLSSSAECHVR
jgi:hypothetical protein